MERISVYVISGFLGSGKTTVLVKMIQKFKEQGRKLGIILNELGDECVESHLFRGEKIYELLNGCICCSIQEDLRKTLDIFMTQNNTVDVLLIEGTGVADPIEIANTLLHPFYIDKFKLKSIISLVDASHYFEYQSIFSSTKEIRYLLRDQIISADCIILNKTDLITEKEKEKIYVKLKKIADSKAIITFASYGNIEFNILVEKRDLAVKFPSESSYKKHHHISTLKIENIPNIQKSDLAKWLNGITNLIRAKGIVFDIENSSYMEIQFAANQLKVNKDLNTDYNKSVIILIGYGLNKTEIQKSFENRFIS
ncbi:CobW family GTP-binding protein [Metabacillus fastidiosus]|uniref:CobW family GTP-binding protein n=1 Tax=Metabacillus fastidiosus TaxID=1458 RepID=UPI003D2CE138